MFTPQISCAPQFLLSFTVLDHVPRTIDAHNALQRLDIILVASLESLKITFIDNSSSDEAMMRIAQDGKSNVLKDVRQELMGCQERSEKSHNIELKCTWILIKIHAVHSLATTLRLQGSAGLTPTSVEKMREVNRSSLTSPNIVRSCFPTCVSHSEHTAKIEEEND